MIRCGNCRVIQKDGAAVCTACGATLGSAGQTAGAGQDAPGSTTGPVLPNQASRGPGRPSTGPILPNQAGTGTSAPPSAPAQPASPPVRPSVPPAPVSGPAGPVSSPPASVVPPVVPSAPPARPPVAGHPGPVVLGPASDPGLGSRSSGSFPPGGGGTPPTAPNPVVVGPPAKAADGNRGLKIAAIVGSSLVLVLLVALVLVLLGRDETTVATVATTTTATSTSTTTIATTTTTAVIPAELNLAAFSRPFTTGEAISVPVGFTGDPNAVEHTELHINGLPSERAGGLKTSFSIDTPLPGTVQVKVVITLKNGEARESNQVAATVIVPTTTAPPPPPVVTYPERDTRTCYGCRTLTIRPGHSDIVVRDRATRSSRVVGKVNSNSYLQGDCYVIGESVTIGGQTSSRWDRLADGNYIWDGFIVEGLREC